MTLLDDLTHGVKMLLQSVAGLAIMVVGFGGLAWEKLHPPTHDAHLLAWLFVGVLGACILPLGGVILSTVLALIGGVVQLLGAITSLLARTPPPPPVP